jgi:hypothetical protein
LPHNPLPTWFLATQDQIRGGGRILSVIVPAGTAGKIVKGIKEAKALRKLDKLIANGKNDSDLGAHFGNKV